MENKQEGITFDSLNILPHGQLLTFISQLKFFHEIIWSMGDSSIILINFMICSFSTKISHDHKTHAC